MHTGSEEVSERKDIVLIWLKDMEGMKGLWHFMFHLSVPI